MTDAAPSALPGISPIRPDEADEESALVGRAFDAAPDGHRSEDQQRRAFARDTGGRAASGVVLVARRGGRLVGSATVLRAATPHSRVAVPGEAEIRLLVVDPGEPGAELGEALVRASLEAALEWGAEALVLDTGAPNPRADALYARLGFERVPERDATASTGEVGALVHRFPLQARGDVRVRLMHSHEADEVSRLTEAAYAVDFELSEAYRADIAAVAERARDHQVWVATDAASGMLLGTASTPRAGNAISPLARDGELDFRFLGVAAGARRRGIGALLVDHVMLLARLRAIPRVVLNTGPDMVAAQRLYEGMGFSRLHEREYVFERADGSSFLMLAYGRHADASPDAA